VKPDYYSLSTALSIVTNNVTGKRIEDFSGKDLKIKYINTLSNPDHSILKGLVNYIFTATTTDKTGNTIIAPLRNALKAFGYFPPDDYSGIKHIVDGQKKRRTEMIKYLECEGYV